MRSFFCTATVLLAVGVADPVEAALTFDDVELWCGSGSSQAALVIDWNDSIDPLVWGFRWDGSASGEDMLRTVVQSDPHLVARLSVRGALLGSDGSALGGLGYDRDGGGFALTDGTNFEPTGIREVPWGDLFTPADAIDPDDSWQSLSYAGLWSYWLSEAEDDPFDGGAWDFAGFQWSVVGMSCRTLSDGDWDGWSFASGFVPSAPDEPVPAASSGDAHLPEPTSAATFGGVALCFGALRAWRRRRKHRARK